MSRVEDTDRLYELLDRLAASSGGPQQLRDATSASGWPTQGVYFFFEPGEFRPNGQPRVVRVGTHALTMTSKTTLWTRLSQHRGRTGGSNPGGGNHRGSIFRLHVGAALIARDDVDHLPLTAWLSPKPLPEHCEGERLVERAVSAYIGQMPVLVLGIPTLQDGSSRRGAIEAGAIALLSAATGGVDRATEGWLGRHAANPAVAASGMWNVRHIHDGYDPSVLDLLTLDI